MRRPLPQACASQTTGAAPWLCHQAPLRIVSLLPSLTETVCALDQCHRLVGVDRYSNYPASVQKLPKVGGGLAPTSRPSWPCGPTWW